MNRLSSSPRSVTPVPKTFSFAPIAVAIAAVLTAAASPVAFAAHAPFVVPAESEMDQGTIFLDLEQISTTYSKWTDDSGALIAIDGLHPDGPGRTIIEWWADDKPDSLYSTSGTQAIEPGEHGKITVTNKSGAFNLG